MEPEAPLIMLHPEVMPGPQQRVLRVAGPSATGARFHLTLDQ